MPDEYTTMLALYRQRVQELDALVEAQLRAEGVPADGVRQELDRLYARATGSCPAGRAAMPLMDQVLAWVTLEGLVGTPPTEDVLAQLLQQVYELEAARRTGSGPPA